jgi:hypothetical protein
MIVSFTHGRIRARLTHLKGQDVPEVPTQAIKGVKNIAINPLTGSVLLEYDPEVINVESIADFLEPFDPEGAATLRNPWLLKPRSILPQAVEVPMELINEEARSQVSATRKAKRPYGSAEATSELINLTVGFLSVVFSAFWSSTRTHALMGAGFGVMVGQHIWKHRRRLRPISQMSWLQILGIDFPFPIKRHPAPLPEPVDPESEASTDTIQGDPENKPNKPPQPQKTGYRVRDEQTSSSTRFPAHSKNRLSSPLTFQPRPRSLSLTLSVGASALLILILISRQVLLTPF